MNYSDELRLLYEETSNREIIEPSDIPDIDLYMDQVTTFMETKLSSFKRNHDDKVLTKTMINNYAKAKLFPPPIKKKYNKNHIMMLIIIYHLKSMLSINDINKLLSPVTNELNLNSSSRILEVLYSCFVEIQKKASSLTIGDILGGNVIAEFEESISKLKIQEEVKYILAVLALSIFSNSEKSFAEKIIDTKF
jgi:hypothetical protein